MNDAAAALVFTLFVHSTLFSCSCLVFSTVASMSAIVSLCSEWLISVPVIPVSCIASGSVDPVCPPGVMLSMCWEYTGICTSFMIG